MPELCPAQVKQKTPAQIIQWALCPLPTRTTWTWTPLLHQPTNDVDSLEARPGTSQTKPNRKLSPPLAGEGAYVPQPTGAPPKTHHKACPRLPPRPCHARAFPRLHTRGHDPRRWRTRRHRPPHLTLPFPLHLPRPRTRPRRRGAAGCSFRPARSRGPTRPRSSTGTTCSRSSRASGASPPRSSPPRTARRTSPRASSPLYR